MPGATVQANSVHKVLNAVRARGLEVAPLLAAVGLREDELEGADARVPFAALAALYEVAAAAAGDEAFGLRIGAGAHPTMFDVLGHAVLSCASLGEAFEAIARYLRVLQEGATVLCVRDGDLARVGYTILDPDVGPHRHEVEATLGIVFRLLDTTVGGGFVPRHVRVMHAAPGDARVHAEIFRVPVEFGQASNELGFDAALLATPMPRADAGLRAILERQIVEMLARLPARGTLVADVRAKIARALERGEPPLGEVARALAMSARTLQRRLAEEQTSFAAILDEVRQELALRYLADPRQTVAETAFLLGYAELSPFHRAFRRWSGQTPGEWRRLRGT